MLIFSERYSARRLKSPVQPHVAIINTCFIVIGGVCALNDSDNAIFLFLRNFSPGLRAADCSERLAQVAREEMQLKR